jgi:hypothetical protein
MVAPEVVPTELVALIGYVLAEALIAVPEGSSAALVAERMYLSVMPENIGQMLDIAIEPPPPENSLEGKIQCSEEFSSKSLN